MTKVDKGLLSAMTVLAGVAVIVFNLPKQPVVVSQPELPAQQVTATDGDALLDDIWIKRMMAVRAMEDAVQALNDARAAKNTSGQGSH